MKPQRRPRQWGVQVRAFCWGAQVRLVSDIHQYLQQILKCQVRSGAQVSQNWGAQVRWKVRKWARCKWESSGCASEAFALAVPSWKLLAAWCKLELIKTQRWKMLLRLCWRLLGMLIWPAMTLLMMHNNIFSVFSVFWWKQVWTSIVPTMTALHH